MVFAYGTMAHLFQLATGGTDPYPGLPVWLTVYFVSLTVLDPLAAALLAARRAAGLVLGSAATPPRTGTPTTCSIRRRE